MPALSFQAQFAELVESGKKTHTIRTVRKRPIKVGDPLILYQDQRVKARSRKLGDTYCSKVESIYFTLQPGRQQLLLRYGDPLNLEFLRNRSEEEIEALAIADGFDDVSEFIEFFFPKKKWEKTPLILPSFSGVLIHGEPLAQHQQEVA
jgi:hypothetical protein